MVLAVLTVSCAAAVTGLTLYAAANTGYAAGITATYGADLAVTINTSKVTAAQLAANGHLPGVTHDAGPYPQATITVRAGAGGHGGAGVPPTTLTVVGRSSPSGPLDDVVANPSVMAGSTHGQSRWPARPGEISLSTHTLIRVPLGARLTVTSAPGHPVLTVVGYGDEVVSPENAWVLPSEIAALRAAGVPAREQMLYRFSNAGTTAQLSADQAELQAALPRGAIADSQTLLTAPPPGTAVRVGATGAVAGAGGQNVNTPFVEVFAILALVLAVLIVANVVSAAVIASYRRIGVLKRSRLRPGRRQHRLHRRHRPHHGRQHHADRQRQAGPCADRWRGVLPLAGPHRLGQLADPRRGGCRARNSSVRHRPHARHQLPHLHGRTPEGAAPSAGTDILVGSEGATSVAGFLDTSLFASLTVLVGVLAGLGVLNAALMATRERVHDLGVFKAVGMTPRQTITMVICWVIAPAIIAAAIALPAGLAIQDHLVRQLATGTALHGNALPGSFVHVLNLTDLVLLALAGLAIAVAGALGPAGWAARTRTAAVLHTE